MKIPARLVVSPLLVILAACGADKAKNAGPPPAPEVGVVTLAPQRVAISNELPGRTAAFRIAEVRPQVSGIILKRLFTEGAEVKAGQQLYQIDAAPYRAAESAARANLASAEAQLSAAKVLAERYEPLLAANAVSKQENDNAVAARLGAAAGVAAARAALDTARINVVYTQLLAPIAGRIGRSLVTEGALVKAEQDQAVATVQQLDPIYVDVSQPSTELLRLQRELAAGRLQQDASGKGAAVKLTLEDGTEYAQPGSLQFSEVSVDPGTGAVLLRAVFPNPKRELLPGMFVRAQLQQGVSNEALLVPQAGVSRNARGQPTVLVVDGEGKVSERVIRTDRVIDGHWLVVDGLKAGEQVIVEGLQKARAGATVKPVPAGAQSDAAAATPGKG